MNYVHCLAMSASLLFIPSVHAIDVVLDFSGSICGETGNSRCTSGDTIGQSYGDLDGVLDVSYRTVSVATGETTGTSLNYWESGYSALTGVAYSSSATSSFGEMTFTPSKNYSLFLDGLDIGSNAAGALSYIGVYGPGGFPTYYSTAFFDAARFTHFDLFRFGYTNPLILRWGPALHVAVDNIKLSLTPLGPVPPVPPVPPVTPAVPEPSSSLLVAVGLILLAVFSCIRSIKELHGLPQMKRLS